MQNGDYGQAYSYYQLELEYANLTNDWERTATSYYHAGQAAYVTSRSEESETNYETAGEYYVQMPDYWRASDSYGWTGNVAYEVGKFEEAHSYYQLDIEYANMTSDSWRKAVAYYHSGQAAYATERYEESLVDYINAGQNYALVPDHFKAGDAYEWAGNVAMRLGYYSYAIEHFVKAAIQFLKVPEYLRAGDCYRKADDAANGSGNCELATLYWEKARQNYVLANVEYDPPSCADPFDSDTDHDKDVDGADLARLVTYFITNFGASDCYATYNLKVVGNANGNITFGKQLCEDGTGELWHDGFDVTGDGGGPHSGADVILLFATHSPPLKYFPPEIGMQWLSSGYSGNCQVNSTAEIVSLDESVSVGAGDFHNCVKVVENLSYPEGYTPGQPYPVKYERWFAPA